MFNEKKRSKVTSFVLCCDHITSDGEEGDGLLEGRLKVRRVAHDVLHRRVQPLALRRRLLQLSVVAQAQTNKGSKLKALLSFALSKFETGVCFQARGESLHRPHLGVKLLVRRLRRVLAHIEVVEPLRHALHLGVVAGASSQTDKQQGFKLKALLSFSAIKV